MADSLFSYLATPTEAFAALAAGADGLKMLPADHLSAAAYRALPQRSVATSSAR